MPTGSHSQFDTGLMSQRYLRGYVVRVRDSYNRQWSAVNAAIEYGARLIVILVVGCDHSTSDGGAQTWDRYFRRERDILFLLGHLQYSLFGTTDNIDAKARN